MFFTDRDVTDASRGVHCREISPGRAVVDVVKAARYLARLIDL